MSSNPDFDRWYAAKRVKVVLSPTNRLETFGNTLVDYHLLSVLADRPDKIRIREGRLVSSRPLVITPDFSEVTCEGMGDEAAAYLRFLREHEKYMRILRYGYSLKSDNFSEQIVTGALSEVTARVVGEVRGADNGYSAVLQGEDEPWDVALVELWRREVDRSAGENIRELQARGELFGS